MGERSRFLERACDGDAALRSKVESLLAEDASLHDALRRDHPCEQPAQWSTARLVLVTTDPRPADDPVGARR